MASLQNDDATLSRSQAIAIAMFVIVAAFTATGFFLTSLQTTERSPQSSLVELSLSDVQALLPSEARTLAESSRTSLDLLALPALTADVAKELAEFPGILNLSGLRSLSTKSAKQLSQLPPSASLILDGLASLPPDTARALAQSRCRYISLNSLKDLTPDLVEELSAYGERASLGCMLHLDGVSSISPATADKVRILKADGLWMDGLENLGEKEAEALAKFRGAVLSLGGLKVTSPAAIEALSDFQGKVLDLSGLEAVSEQTAKALVAFRGEMLLLGGLIKPSETVLAILRERREGITLPKDQALDVQEEMQEAGPEKPEKDRHNP